MQLNGTGEHLALVEQESLELLFLLAVSRRALLPNFSKISFLSHYHCKVPRHVLCL